MSTRHRCAHNRHHRNLVLLARNLHTLYARPHACLCSGRSMDKGCEYAGRDEACVPGCTPQTWPCTLADVRSSSTCAWGPMQLEQLFRQADHARNFFGYNEIVIDPTSVEKHLPYSVLAVYRHAAGSSEAAAESAAVHARFLKDYPHLTSADVPLLEYSTGGGTTWQPGSPRFTCVSCS